MVAKGKLSSDYASLSNSLLLFVLMGFMAVCVSCVVVYMTRLENATAFPSLPSVSWAQCVGMCSVYVSCMAVYIWHCLENLRMLRMGMPLIPGPIPFLGHALRFLSESPWNIMLKWHSELGDIIVFPLMGRRLVSLANPTHLRAALQSKIKAVKKDVGFSYQPFLVILGRGIVTSEGQEWMKQRLKMSTALRIRVLQHIPAITLDATQRLMAKFDAAAENNEPVELAEALRHLTLQVISKTFLSITADESDSTFAQIYLPIVDECNMRVWHPYRDFCFFLPFWWRHQSNVHRLNSYVSKLIRDRWELRRQSQERHGDILDLVLDAHDKHMPGRLTYAAVRQMRDEFKTFLLAGHETSAAMMTWAFYELMANQKLQSEVSTTCTVQRSR